MKILFIAHVEPAFEKFTTPAYLYKLGRVSSKYDKVILLESGIGNEQGEISFDLGVDEVWSWSYGPDENECWCWPQCEDECKWIVEASGHEFAWIPEEIRDVEQWREHDIGVGGGSRNECLADWCDVLEYLGLSFTYEEEIVY